jgi:hypothetical protein
LSDDPNVMLSPCRQHDQPDALWASGIAAEIQHAKGHNLNLGVAKIIGSTA